LVISTYFYSLNLKGNAKLWYADQLRKPISKNIFYNYFINKKLTMAIMPFEDLRDEINAKLLPWYRANHRDLPWRQTTDPYKIWLSEVILQQTRVVQGLPYYLAFENAFETIYDFANATEDQVLRLWQGLGYYSRGRNMLKTAKYIVQNCGGGFPNSYETLLKLPGVGPYTAAAIASFAFKLRHAVVDGNVLRVLARLLGDSTDIGTEKGKRHFEGLAAALIDHTHPDVFNQAIMELGATVCTPKKTACLSCPLQNLCVAHQMQAQGQFPQKTKKVPAKKRLINYLVCLDSDEILMKKRANGDIWQGLYDFPTKEDFVLNDLDLGPPRTIKHQLTHQSLEVRFYKYINHEKKSIPLLEGWHWLKHKKVEALPKPIVIEKYLKTYIFETE
jgi:A/G-specific adenine glycosylase